jgi:glycerol-3-phosphate dehydrogenase
MGQATDEERAMDTNARGDARLNAQTRHANLEAMTREPLDVLVIGGGITGAGVALDAVTRGYRVGLVERADFASGTSSRSTKLLHGGIRYLPQFDIALVSEGLHERGWLLRNAPHLAHPLAFLLPLYDSSRKPVGLPVAPPFGIGLTMILDIGLWLYDRLAGKRSIAPHRKLSRAETISRMPGLTEKGVKSGFLYYDGQTDDARLTLAVLRTAAAHGALVANYAEVTRYASEDDRIIGAYARETLDGDGTERLMRARHVVNATGVWAEANDHLSNGESLLHIAPSKGAHLVFTRERLGLGDEAIVLPETEDGRIIFVVPWLSRAIVGTTDTETSLAAPPVAVRDDITYLLDHLNRYLRKPVTRTDIVSTFAGYRPLLRLKQGTSTGHLSRAHEVVERADGLVTVSGGKMTSYRQMAEDVVNHLQKREGKRQPSATRTLRLQGATRWPESRERFFLRAGEMTVDATVAEHLVQGYGDEALEMLDLIAEQPTLRGRLVPDLPYLRAEVVHACRVEMALTLEDLLARRLRITLEDRARGLNAAAEVVALMARELGWSDEERAERLNSYDEYVRAEAGPLADLLPPPHPLAAVRPAQD